jgi:hypothetical protein
LPDERNRRPWSGRAREIRVVRAGCRPRADGLARIVRMGFQRLVIGVHDDFGPIDDE